MNVTARKRHTVTDIRARNVLPFVRTALWRSLFPILLLGAAGCVTTSPEEQAQAAAPLSVDALRKLYEGAKDPRQFWITVYPSGQGPVFSGTHRLYEAQLSEFAFKTGDPTPAPVIKFRGHTTEFYQGLIDTSAADNWTDFARGLEMGAELLASPGYASRAMHVPDTVDGYLAVMDRVRLEGVNVGNALFFIRGVTRGLGPLGREVEKPEAAAVLGMRFLEPFSFVRLNFNGKMVAFSSTHPYEPPPGRLIASAPIAKDAGGALGVEGSVNGKPATIILDTAGAYHVALPDPEETEVRHIGIGGLVLRHEPCSSLGEEGLGLEEYPRVGLDILSRFVLVIDNAAGMVHFERGAE